MQLNEIANKLPQCEAWAQHRGESAQCQVYGRRSRSSVSCGHVATLWWEAEQLSCNFPAQETENQVYLENMCVWVICLALKGSDPHGGQPHIVHPARNVCQPDCNFPQHSFSLTARGRRLSLMCCNLIVWPNAYMMSHRDRAIDWS